MLSPLQVQAEGSAELVENGGKRALTEWRTTTTAGLYRRTFFRVYAEAGESILMGSSAVGINSGDIVLYQEGQISNSQITPAGLAAVTPVFRCSTYRVTNPGAGALNTRAKELAGPLGNPGGYLPCIYTAPATGTYWVAMYGPDGASGNADGAAGTIAAPVVDATQRSGVSMWDITVRRGDPLTGSTRPGRVFVDYLAQISGGNGTTTQMFSSLFAATMDGYVYRVDLNGLDPNGYILYGNRVGFLDPDGRTPLYHDVVYPDNTLSAPYGGVILAPARAKIFFNNPLESGDLPPSILPTPEIPTITNVTYEGSANSNTGYQTVGGLFRYTGNVGGISEIIVQGAGSTDFEPDNPLNRRLLGESVIGTNSIAWDGRDNQGIYFPVGMGYQYRVIFHAGEYHFPLLDAENSQNGGPVLTLLNPIGGVCPFNPNCHTAFYDDRVYRVSTGAIIPNATYTVGNTLPGDATATNPPAVNHSDQNTGFDTSTNQRAYGGTTSTGFGNYKALDLWAYYPVSPVNSTLNVVNPVNQDLRIVKTHSDLFRVGTNAGSFSITVSNVGTANMGGTTTVADTLPAGMTLFAAPSGTGWACGGAAGGTSFSCTRSDTLNAGASFPVISMPVNVVSTTGQTMTNTATVANPNDGNASNNSSSDTVTILVPELSITKTNDTAGLSAVGSTFHWNITAANTGSQHAVFSDGETILRDPLPTGATYEPPLISSVVNVINSTSINCAVDGSNVLTCMAVGANVTLVGPGGSLEITIPVTPTVEGSLANTATVDPNGVVEEANEGNNSASDTVQVLRASLSLEKTSTTTEVTAAGQIIPYALRVTNTGTMPLHDITVTDPNCTSAISYQSGDANADAALDLAEAWVYTCTHTVTQAEIDNGGNLTNTATADSSESQPATGTLDIPITQNAAMTVAKTADAPGPFVLNDLIQYTIVVTNTGSVTLHNVTVTDSSAALGTCTPAQPATLAPNATLTCPASHTVTQTDIDAGSYANTASGDSDETDPRPSTVTIPFAATPAVSLTKTGTLDLTVVAPDTLPNPGDVIQYAFTVTNTGNVTLNGISISDTVGGVTISGGPLASLAPGASDSTTFTGTYTLTQADIDAGTFTNTATVTATPPSGPDVSDTDDDTQTLPAAPNLAVLKSETSTGPYVVGGTITYSIVATNTGNVTLHNVTVTDSTAVVGTCTPAQPANLVPGSVMTCPASHVVTQADVDAGTYTNTATGDSGETTPTTSTVPVTFPRSPALTVVKSETSSGPYAVGDTISYSIVATNSGNVTLHNVAVTDNSAVLGTCTPAQPAALAPGASMICPASHVVTQADVDAGSYTNTATGDSDETTPTTSTVPVTFSNNPALSVLKEEASTGPYGAGDTITYSITATNTGNVTLHNVTVTDNAATLGTCTPAQPATLAPNTSMVCPASHLVTQGDVDLGSYENTAAGDSDETGTQTSTVNVPLLQNPGLSVLKEAASSGPFDLGDTITYSITVTNTGNVTLHNVSVTDTSAVLGTCAPAQPATLAPNAVMACSASHVVTQADADAGQYTNTASGDSDETGPQTSTVNVPVTQTPALSVVKSETSTGPYVLGGTITYSIVATNTGNVTLHNVRVTDPTATLGACTPAQPAVLAPAATMTCPASHVVTQGDIDAGSYSNTATADSDETPTTTSTETVNFPAAPGISLVKTGTLDMSVVAPASLANAGDVITYAFTVTNTGNVTLTNITLADTVGGVTISGGPIAVLGPGASDSTTFTGSYALTQADVNAGLFNNIATTSGTPPSGGPVTDTDDDNQSFPQAPNMTITKTVTSSGPYVNGSTITYAIVVTNTGNVSLTNVSVTDAGVGVTLGACAPAQPATLAPGASMTCPASHVTTQADVDAGVYNNTATADSDQTGTVSDDETVTITATPGINLVKDGTLNMDVVAPDGIPDAGDTISYTFTVTNTGNVTLTNITLADTVGGVTISGGPIASLEPGASDSTTFTGSYTLTQDNVTAGFFTNTATVSGNPPSGAPVTDADDDTQEMLPNPILGLAKRVVGTPTAVSPGVWDVRYEILVRNYGNLPILDLQVTDDLAATYPLPTTFSVQSRTSSAFTINSGYNGSTNTNLLAGTDTLVVGAEGTITLVVRVTPAEVGPFNNTAEGSGMTAAELPVGDGSQNGDTPDPDGNGDPTDNNDPTPVDFGPRIFNPPFGIKAVNADGLPVLRWTVDWINHTNVVGIAATAKDAIPFGTTYLAAGAASGYPVPTGAPAGSTNLGVSCTADPASTVTVTTLCYYEGPSATHPRGQIIWRGILGPDLGATSAANANDEMRIVFGVTVNSGITSVENTATIDSDLNGDGDTDDSGEIQVATTSAGWTLTVRPRDVDELPETGFAPGMVTSLPEQPAAKAYLATSDLSIEIPALGIETAVVGVPYEDGGWDTTWLGNNAGWLGGTAFPSWKGNSVITGHVYNAAGLPGPFADLSKLKWGDRIIVEAFGQRYVYEVRFTKLIDPDDTTVLEHKNNAWITLLTCKEYNEKKGTYLRRVAVQAVLIKVEDVK